MEFIFIATAHFLALISPGPDFFLIVQVSLRLPLRYAISVCLGIAAANALYLICAVTGLEFIKGTPWLMTLLKYLGAFYLIYLGFLLLRAPRQSSNTQVSDNFLQIQHMGKQFLVGFLSGILNPKNAIFYLSLFTVIVSDQTDLMTKSLYALWMTSIVFIWDTLIALVLSRESIRAIFGRTVFVVEKVSGLMLALFGLFLPFA